MSVTSEVIQLKNVRLSFAKTLFKAEGFKGGDENKKYSAAFLLDPSDKAQKKIIKTIEAAADALIKEEWDGKVKLKSKCFGAGEDQTNDNGEVYAGYEDMFYINASKNESEGRPLIVDGTRNNAALTIEDGRPYSGCIVNATLTMWTQNNKWGNRINGNLRGIQFVADGEAFGAASLDAENEFDALDDDDFLED